MHIFTPIQDSLSPQQLLNFDLNGELCHNVIMLQLPAL